MCMVLNAAQKYFVSPLLLAQEAITCPHIFEK